LNCGRSAYSFLLTEISNDPNGEPDLKIFIEPKEKSAIEGSAFAQGYVSANRCFRTGQTMVQVTWCKGGTGNAEPAKLSDAGISLKQYAEKMSGRKRLAY
jgi:hypothetical protein